MSQAHIGGHIRETIGNEDGNVARGAAGVLSLAAAPTFAVMAALTGVLDGANLDVLCQAAHGGSPISGMVVMYLLMSAFHSAPWLKLISGRGRGQ